MIPVILFVFNRPQTTELVLDALSKQTIPIPKLIVFADGARFSEEQEKVDSVRALIRAIDWTEVELIARERNFGCAPNIVQGLTSVFQSHEQAVVVEDDVLPAAHLYESFCILLAHYKDDTQVFSVGGYPSIKSDALPNYPFDVILSPRFSCWGWGTWANRWHDVEAKILNFQNPFPRPIDVPVYAGADLPQTVKLIKKRPGFYWDYPIALLCLQQGLLHALTRHYLTSNIGVDTGAHATANPQLLEFLKSQNQISEITPIQFPPPYLQNDICEAIQRYAEARIQAGKHNIFSRIVSRIAKRIPIKLKDCWNYDVT